MRHCDLGSVLKNGIFILYRFIVEAFVLINPPHPLLFSLSGYA